MEFARSRDKGTTARSGDGTATSAAEPRGCDPASGLLPREGRYARPASGGDPIYFNRTLHETSTSAIGETRAHRATAAVREQRSGGDHWGLTNRRAGRSSHFILTRGARGVRWRFRMLRGLWRRTANEC